MKRCMECGEDLLNHSPDLILVHGAMVAAFGPNPKVEVEF